MLIAAVVAVLSAQGGPLDPWGASKPGSWVFVEETRSSPNFLADKKTKDHTKLAKMTDKAVTVYVGNSKDGEEPDIFFPSSYSRDEIGWLNAKEVSVRNRKEEPNADVSVGGQKFSCKVRSLEYVHRYRPLVGEEYEYADRLKIWESADIPGRVAKLEGTWTTGDPKVKQVWSFEGSVTALSEKVSIAGRDVPCAKLEVRATARVKRTTTTWISKEVPGMVARTKTVEGTGESQLITDRAVIKFEFGK